MLDFFWKTKLSNWDIYTVIEIFTLLSTRVFRSTRSLERFWSTYSVERCTHTFDWFTSTFLFVKYISIPIHGFEVHQLIWEIYILLLCWGIFKSRRTYDFEFHLRNWVTHAIFILMFLDSPTQLRYLCLFELKVLRSTCSFVRFTSKYYVEGFTSLSNLDFEAHPVI